MAQKIILVRHADYVNDRLNPDPEISEDGKEQALKLGDTIRRVLNGEDVSIWSSSAKRAHGTAEIIKSRLPLADLTVKEKLWSDRKHHHDFLWLLEQIESFEGNLIIVSHLEYVNDFPMMFDLPTNQAGYAEGVIIELGENKSCIPISA